jgi:enoyl-CoA hydratase/carnithine racemase
MTNPAIYREQEGAVATIIFNRPERRNALDLSMWEGLAALLGELERDGDVRVVVIRGADERAFAAGADIKEFGTVHADPQTSRDYNTKVHAASDKVVRFAKPLIAMIQGPCVGGGCAIALGCDLRIADKTSRFGIPPANLGLVYSIQDTKLLVDAVGAARARELLFTGRLIDATEALGIGLIDRLVDADAIVAETRSLCEAICASSQYSVRAAKRFVRLILDGAAQDTDETLRMFDEAFQGEDFREGTAAFMAKRKPKFTFR